jgi:hypothetical protein
MTIRDLLEQIRAILPDGGIGRDYSGQLIVYTGLQSDDDTDLLIPFQLTGDE